VQHRREQIACCQKRPFVSPGLQKAYLYTDAIFHPESSRYGLDFFTIQQIQHGILHYVLLSLVSSRSGRSVLEMIASSLLIAGVWEILENTPCCFQVFHTAGDPSE